MLNFTVDADHCIRCGLCAKDCVAGIIAPPADGKPPSIPAEREEECIGCQHCLAICPTAAISIMGVTPDDVPAVSPADWPAPEAIEALARGRRSMRQYKKESLDSATMNRLRAILPYAPTGVNARATHFAILDSAEKLNAFREQALDALDAVARAGKLPERLAWMAEVPALWREKGEDTLFRGAPHLIVACNRADAPCPREDCIIALTYFEVLAQTLGVGTTWCGLVYHLLAALPDLRRALAIPDGYEVGYAMLFGRPAVHYPRAVKR